MLNIDKDAKLIFDLFKKHNQEIYLVGGAVRDLLLKKVVTDYDFATPCLPIKIETILKDFKVDKKGKDFGSFSFKIENKTFQITTFRKEKYTGIHYPSKITFIKSLKKDARRRDFTINAIYFKEGKLYDPQNGLKDLKNKKIKLIGKKNKRLKEDPLRILRAIRFAANLNFNIEPRTLKALKDNFYLLKKINKNLLTKELTLINIEKISDNLLKELILNI